MITQLLSRKRLASSIMSLRLFILSLRTNALELVLFGLTVWWSTIISFHADNQTSLQTLKFKYEFYYFLWGALGYVISVFRIIGLYKHKTFFRRFSAIVGSAFWSSICIATYMEDGQHSLNFVGTTGTFLILAVSCLLAYLLIGIETRMSEKVEAIINDEH